MSAISKSKRLVMVCKKNLMNHTSNTRTIRLQTIFQGITNTNVNLKKHG